MDFEDLEDLDAPKNKVPSRTSKFAPKSSKIRGKTQQRPPISEVGSPDSTPKSEAQESAPEAKSEPQNAPVLGENRDEEDIKPKIDAMEETEGVVSNSGAEGMEVDRTGDEQGEEEEDDPIVREIDVYFNPSLGPDSQLYVMQYPLRPKWRPYELDERCEEVRIRPGTKEVEMDLSIDDSTNWDHAQASKFNMKKQTLTSKFMPSHSSNYAVGFLIGDKLFLNPIDAVVQLRPSLAHLDSTSNTGAAIKSEDVSEGKPGPSKKQVKGSELEDDQTSEEPWVRLKYYGSKSEMSSMYLQKMMTEESSELEFDMNPSDYMKSLCPVNNSSKPKRLSKSLLLSLPLEERVKKLFLEGPPIQQFRFISHFAPDATPEELLAVLRKHGRLVQGLWVANTALLFQDAKDMTKMAARDYVLLSFSKKPIVKSSELNLPVKLKEDAKHFLNIFAIERELFKDWKFKEQKDWEFIKLYKEIELEQEEAWKTTDERLKIYFGKIGKPMNTLSKQGATHNPVKVSNSEKSVTKAASGSTAVTKSTISVETREALLKALPKVFQNHKVCKFEVICQGLQELAISQSSLPKSDPKMLKALASGADAPPEELREIIGEIAFDIHGSYVLKSSPDHPQYDDFRKVVVDLFLERGSDAKLKRAELSEAARFALRREITQTEYTKVVTDLCETRGSFRVLKSGDGKPS